MTHVNLIGTLLGNRAHHERYLINLTAMDVVRHPLVQRIVNAYDRYEQDMSKKKEKDTGKRIKKDGRK